MFTWVDGSDPVWRATFDRWVTTQPPDIGDDARHPARYRDNGELRYALRSVRRFAPWVRHIHLVTAGQVPGWLRTDHPSLRLVPHGQIVAPADLPTFNSHAIECRLHHIPGLAEHFVYFNDDVFLARPQPAGNFFDHAGTPLVAIAPKTVPRRLDTDSASCDHSAFNGVRLIERDLGLTPCFRPRHGPFALRRSHLFDLEARFRSELTATAARRFRSSTDVSLPTFLAPMHGLLSGAGGRSPAAIEELNVDDADLRTRLDQLGPNTAFDAFCLNDTERVEPGPGGPRAVAARFLERRFDTPAPWEFGEWPHAVAAGR